jgi:SAM-dependent methyltransferase
MDRNGSVIVTTAEEADALIRQYESISCTDVQRNVLHLIPVAPSRILDIGVGTGRDAAGFAAMGHRVAAVEPTAALRVRAAALHPSPLIEWLDDSPPDLPCLTVRAETFDVVMLTAVWMYLGRQQRRQAMPRVASLVRSSGAMTPSLRRGPVSPPHRHYDRPS